MSDADMKQLFEFCRELYPDESPIPLHAPRFFGNEKKYLSECIDSTYVSYVGEFVQKLEKSLAEFVGCDHAISLCNGTVALHIALVAANVQDEDEVLVPTLTFVAAANAISHVGARCVFVDSEIESMGMSPEKLDDFLTAKTERRSDGFTYNKATGKKIAACVPVHVFGHPAKIDAIRSICDRAGIALIEDSSESLGSFFDGKHTGTFGKCGVFSFNGNKTITTGGGGMVVTNDSGFADRVRHLATTAKLKHPFEFVHDEVGYNYRMPNLNAAVGLAQMENIDLFLKNKIETASKYRSFCSGRGFKFIDQPVGSTSNFWLNAIALESKLDRDRLLNAAIEERVQIRPVWRLMHHLPMYSNCQKTDLSVAEKFEATVVNLPSSVRLKAWT